MANFADLLNRPLPSMVAAVEESVEDTNTIQEGAEDNVVVMQSEPIEVPAEPVSVPPTPEPIIAKPEEVVAVQAEVEPVDNLTPEENRNVDDVLNSVGTALLLNDEMNEEEYKEFVNGLEGGIAEAEGFLTERTIVRLDKNAKKAHLYELALFTVAREKNDRDWKKLQTVYKMKRMLKARLRKKYNNLAMKKYREYLDRARKSKSGILAKIANKMHSA